MSGEQFNFGPRAEQNRTVVEIIGTLARHWGFLLEQEPFEVTANVPFHEAGLLKLICDKALLLLRWEPTLQLEECLHMTGDWYRRFYQEQRNALELMDEQRSAYENLARERQRAWAIGG